MHTLKEGDQTDIPILSTLKLYILLFLQVLERFSYKKKFQSSLIKIKLHLIS